MKPDWDQLMKEYEGSSTVLIGDADCTAGGKSLCDTVGVRGYPTIKYGSPDDLQDYKGGRSFADLKKHAETLGPSCGPANLDLCDEETDTNTNKIIQIAWKYRKSGKSEGKRRSGKIHGNIDYKIS